jgi:hypothetical protein
MLSADLAPKIRSKSNLGNTQNHESLTNLHQRENLHRMASNMRLTISNIQQRYKLKYGMDFK